MSNNLCNMYNGDGRNDSIFSHLCAVRKKYPKLDEKIEEIGGFANTLFAEPLDDRELHNTINSVLSRTIETNQKEFKPLDFISATDLKNKELKPIKFIVNKFLPQGLNILCSPPKYGKSFMVLDLCLCVASGQRFLNHTCNQCGCLYLALEDSYNRLKDRMDKVLNGGNPSPNFYFSISCESISTSLIEQLKDYIQKIPDIGLIVIDTLQKIRGNSANNDNSYGNDYKDLGVLKNFADQNELCILLVHHLRKKEDNGDVFSRISGTTAIMGACDTTFVLSRENRNDNQTILSMTGRDIEENEYVLEFDKTNFRWKMMGTLEAQIQQDQWENYNNNLIVKTIKAMFEQNENGFEITAEELNNKCLELFGEYADSTASALARKMPSLAKLLYSYDGIIHTPPPKNGAGRKKITQIQV